MLNLDMGEYKGQTGLSPPTAYPSTVGNKVNEDSSYPRQHVYTIGYYSSVHARVIRLYQSPSTRASTMGTDDEPANK